MSSGRRNRSGPTLWPSLMRIRAAEKRERDQKETAAAPGSVAEIYCVHPVRYNWKRCQVMADGLNISCHGCRFKSKRASWVPRSSSVWWSSGSDHQLRSLMTVRGVTSPHHRTSQLDRRALRCFQADLKLIILPLLLHCLLSSSRWKVVFPFQLRYE